MGRCVAGFVLPIVLLCLPGCAGRSSSIQWEYSELVGSDRQCVWEYVLEFIDAAALPIMSEDVAMNRVASAWFDASSAGSADGVLKFCDCGDSDIECLWTCGKLSICVISVGKSSSELKIKSVYTQRRVLVGEYSQQNRKFNANLPLSGAIPDITESQATFDCSSTGVLEALVLEYVNCRVAGKPPPHVPLLAPRELN